MKMGTQILRPMHTRRPLPPPNQDHISFLNTWPGKKVLDSVQECYGPKQFPVCFNVTLFNSHCVAGTKGADLVGENTVWCCLLSGRHCSREQASVAYNSTTYPQPFPCICSPKLCRNLAASPGSLANTKGHLLRQRGVQWVVRPWKSPQHGPFAVSESVQCHGCGGNRGGDRLLRPSYGDGCIAGRVPGFDSGRHCGRGQRGGIIASARTTAELGCKVGKGL